MSAIVFVTSTQALRNSLAFVTGVLVATAIGVALILGLQSLLGIDLGDPDDNTSTGHIIQYVLIAAAIRNYVRRATIKPPKRLGKLQGSGPLHRPGSPTRPSIKRRSPLPESVSTRYAASTPVGSSSPARRRSRSRVSVPGGRTRMEDRVVGS